MPINNNWSVIKHGNDRWFIVHFHNIEIKSLSLLVAIDAIFPTSVYNDYEANPDYINPVFYHDIEIKSWSLLVVVDAIFPASIKNDSGSNPDSTTASNKERCEL